MMSRPSYTGANLDRASQLRRDSARLAELLAGPERRLMPLWRNRHAVTAEYEILTLRDAGEGEAIFLGLVDDVPWFAVDLSAREEPPELGGMWMDLREIGPNVKADAANLMATARGLFAWHRRHMFCGVCGAPTEMLEGGHLRLCTNTHCATPHFPRTDPAVIMLVTDESGRALLGRQAKWPDGMVSTLAGFVEPGENLEEAVAREVFEETGVRVRDVTYVASQPWPFPSSLMLAFRAVAETVDITVDRDELEEAHWFSREQVRAFRETATEGPGWALPRADSVARYLIEQWLHE